LASLHFVQFPENFLTMFSLISFLGLSLLCLSRSGLADNSTACPDAWHEMPLEDNQLYLECMHVSPYNMTLSEAFHYCLGFKNATLLSIHNESTIELAKNISNGSTYWLGGQIHKFGAAEVYRWLDGSNFNMANFARTRQYCREEFCVIYGDLDGSWEGVDFDDTVRHKAACLMTVTHEPSITRRSYYYYMKNIGELLSKYPIEAIRVSDNPEISSLIEQLKQELIEEQHSLATKSDYSFASRLSNVKVETELAGFATKFFVIGLLVMVFFNFVLVLALCLQLKKLRKRLGFYGSSW